MSLDSTPLRLLLVAAGAGLLIWNGIAISTLSGRLDSIETRIDKSPSALVDLYGPDGNNPAGGWDAQHSSGKVLQGSRSGPSGIGDADEFVDNLKRAQIQIAPEQESLQMSTKLAQESSNPVKEAIEEQWLQKAAQDTKGPNVPMASDVSSQCRGQRCLTTATFANEGDARMWATRYLLTAGGGMLSNSRTVILPGQGGGPVTMHLYLF